MKRNLLIAFLAAVMALPGFASADVMSGAGNVTLLGHIDFVGRYSAEDKDEGWMGYETYNLEFAVLGIAGQLGDNVDWVITEAFTFVGPYGSLNSAAALDNTGGVNNEVNARLLDARINMHMGESLILSVGRFIPPTSMTWNPHLLKVLYTINYPLLNGSGLQGGGALAIPLPMYQTGAMLTAKMGPASLMVGHFNGSEIVGGPNVGGIEVHGANNVIDIDKTKGALAKLAVDTGGFHFGGFYYGEFASVQFAKTPPGTGTLTGDAQIDQWGLEMNYASDMWIGQAQYLSTTLDFYDDVIDDDLIQNGWYALLGANLGQAQIVARYDYFMYDAEEIIVSEDMNEEVATTIGVNYKLNENVIAGLNYTIRDIEDWDANTDEIAVIVETNLF